MCDKHCCEHEHCLPRRRFETRCRPCWHTFDGHKGTISESWPACPHLCAGRCRGGLAVRGAAHLRQHAGSAHMRRHSVRLAQHVPAGIQHRQNQQVPS